MNISAEVIKELRNLTGVSVMQCRKALEEAGGDIEKAKIVLRKQSSQSAAKKADRELGAGTIRSYIHGNGQIGVLVELACETDFVAKNADFIQLADDIAMQVAALNPKYISVNEITEEERAKAKDVMMAEVADLDKPAEIKEKIVEGKMSDFFKEQVLMSQEFVKNPELTIANLVEGAVQKIGERIEIRRVVRFSVQE